MFVYKWFGLAFVYLLVSGALHNLIQHKLSNELTKKDLAHCSLY